MTKYGEARQALDFVRGRLDDAEAAEAKLAESVRLKCEDGGCGACVACREAAVRAYWEAKLAEAERVLVVDRSERELAEALIAELKTKLAEAERRADEEARRWQDRIEAEIVGAGLEPVDASGNESGDPLDWTADQVRRALGDLGEAKDAIEQKERKECAKALARWARARWEAEVKHRPSENIYRRMLSNVWRQVERDGPLALLMPRDTLAGSDYLLEQRAEGAESREKALKLDLDRWQVIAVGATEILARNGWMTREEADATAADARRERAAPAARKEEPS